MHTFIFSIILCLYFLLLLWGDFFSPGVLYLLDYGFGPHPRFDWTYSLGITVTQLASVVFGPAFASKGIFLFILLSTLPLSILLVRKIGDMIHIDDSIERSMLILLSVVFLTANPFAYERMMVQPMIYA
jgi:hypothetical protein